jgi:acyl-CoA synthetase (AMP-forming)/AMP-acid ligase II
MIHVQSLGRAARYYPERPALSSGATRLTFGELHGRVVRVAATLSRHGFAAGDRLALLLPNEAEYLELVYACARLGVIAVPLNTRLSAVEIDRVLTDAGPHGLVRHSTLPAPTVQVRWQRVLDKEPLELQSDSCPEAIYDPDAVLALIYTSGTTGHPKGVMLTQFPELAHYDLGSLKQVGYGGSPMAPEVIHRTRAVFPNIKLVQVYGLSETGFLTALKDDEHTPKRLLSCGRPCPGVDVRVVDESGTEVGVGQPGEVVARGANVMRGYWNNREETLGAFRNGLFRTGDVGYQDAEGYLYILDRVKDMIVTGGENVYSGEVEAVLYEHPAVREAAVFGIPDAKWGELVMACVVLKPGTALSVDELIAHCRRSLASYKVPRRVEFSDLELPKTGSGKILKRALRDRFWAHQARAVG